MEISIKGKIVGNYNDLFVYFCAFYNEHILFYLERVYAVFYLLQVSFSIYMCNPCLW